MILMSMQVPYDLLIGADGVGSIVRAALNKLMPSNYERRYRHNQSYCTAPITTPVSGGHPMHASLQGHPLFKVHQHTVQDSSPWAAAKRLLHVVEG